MFISTYKYKFPVDSFDRPGGMYSLTDLPVAGFKVLERECEVLTQDSKQKLYEVRDIEKNWTLVVPFEDIGDIEEVENEVTI